MKITLQSKCLCVLVYLTLTSCDGGAPTESSSSVARSSTVPDACTLLTAAELEETMNIGPGAAEHPYSFACQWPSPDSPLPIAYLGVSAPNIGSWQEYRESLLKEGFADPDIEGERIDIGRFGHYQQDVGTIQVQSDSDILITLNIPGSSKEQIVDLARKAVARLP